jgi:hypothetical protein
MAERHRPARYRPARYRPARYRPARYRTFGARRVTRAALVLLVVGVAVAGLWDRWREDGGAAPPVPRPSSTAPPATPSR